MKKTIRLLAVFLLSLSAGALLAGKIPNESPVRVEMNFNADWLFFRGEISADSASAADYPDANWQRVRLPHFPKVTPIRHPWRLDDSQGINWYRKRFHLEPAIKGKKVFLEFEGIDQVADIWINGFHLVTHKGSFLPLIVDVTDHAWFGNAVNTVAVKADNKDNRDIPVYGNWISYGGIYRDVRLFITDRLHVTDAVYQNQPAGGGQFVTYPTVTDSLAEIQIKTHVINEYPESKSCRIRTQLLDADGRLVKTAESLQEIPAGQDWTFDQRMSLTKFKLWHPDHPYRYTIQTEILDGDKRVDSQEIRIGIRRIQFSHENGFQINGERLVFMGTNRVQEYPYAAWASPNASQRKDAILLKETGFQYVRTSHMPPDPSFLDACDELGILVMDCTPGFQFIGGPEFRRLSFQNMRDMIRRDRNHPSVILWELSLNETDYDSSFAVEAHRIGHEEFPGDQCFVSGWKFPSIYDVFIQASQHGARRYQDKTPLVISEYGHWDYFKGRSSTSDVERSDGEAAMLAQVNNHWESLNANRALPFLCGDGLWVGLDFQCYPSGIIDYFRIPKFSRYFFQSQRDPDHLIPNLDSGPMVFIANYWTATSPRTVTVFSNCEEVNLFLNGQPIAAQKPDTSGRSRYLLHPPFVFENIVWKPGELKAVGFIHNREAASFIRYTPGEPKSLALSFDRPEPALADGEEMFFVYASLKDSNGAVVHNVKKTVNFEIRGSGQLISPSQVETEAGIATALIQTDERSGEIFITAKTDDIGEATIVKKVIHALSQ